MGETVNLNVICPDDQKTQVPVTINLDEIELLSGAEHRTDIALTDEITMNFRYPIMSDLQGGKSSEVSEQSFKLLNKCVASIQSGDTVFNRVDMSDKDIDDFIDQMNNRQFEDVMNFFNSMPKLRHVVNVTNPKTNVQSEVVLEGLNNFLG